MNKITKCHYFIVRTVVVIFISIAIFEMIKDQFDSEALPNHFFIIWKSLSLLIISFVPNLLKKLDIKVPFVLLNVYLLSVTYAILFGEILGFYKTIRIWDSIIHFLNGGLISIIGFSIINLLNAKNENVKISPLIVVFFSFCFSISVGVVWELIEWGADALTGSNMQRFRDNFDSTILFQGRAALFDTMKDLLLNTLGALLFCIFGYIDSGKNQYINKWFLITKKTKENTLYMTNNS